VKTRVPALATLALRFALGACLLAPGLFAHANRAHESDLKIAYAYNFVVLSTWPTEAPPSLRFCVAGAAANAEAFALLNGKVARERPIRVEAVATPERAAECQVLFVPRAESARFGAWVGAVAKLPVLTIGEDAPAPGGIVNLRLQNDQVVFDVDTRAASAARIVLSSQLLKLAASRQ
jgi:hypothetical protein